MEAQTTVVREVDKQLALQKFIVVNCSQTRYHVVRAAAVALGWCVEDEGRDDVPLSFHGVSLQSNFRLALEKRLSSRGLIYAASTSPQILWLDKSVLASRISALSCHHRVNHFPGMHVIARKAVLFKLLMRIRRRPDLSPALATRLRAFPPSFSALAELPLLERLLCEQQGREESFFILKPNKGCQGKGIILTPDPLLALERVARKTGDDWLVQLYVTPPLCIERKKFDLRIYVLLTSVVSAKKPQHRRRRPGHLLDAKAGSCSKNNDRASVLDGLQVFVHRDGIVRICTEEYVAPNRDNCGLSNIHLTNYAVNKNSVGFSVGHAVGSEDSGVCEGNKRDFKFLREYINGLPDDFSEQAADSAVGGAASTRWDRVLRRIDVCIMLTILSGWEQLQREFIGTGASRGSRCDGRNCFELLGFDIMLTDALEPVLIEVNHSPSLFCDSLFDFETKRSVVMDVFRLLEPYIPSLEDCDDGSYAAHQTRAHACGTPTGFRQISPQRAAFAGGVCDFAADAWCEEEMSVFQEMLRHAKPR